MKATSWLAASLLVLTLAACSAEATPTPTALVTPLKAIESPPSPQASPTPALATQGATDDEPASSETAIPASGTPTAADTPTQQPQPTATTAEASTVQNLPDPASFTWNPVGSGLDNPVGLANAGDGSGRLFVLEQEGRIRILQNGELLPQPFLDISEGVVCCGERGLLGIAFHPNYTQNGYFYINYTELQGQQLTSVIARYQVSNDANAADTGSEFRLLEQPQPYNNHNGGGLEFGPDGYLYIGLGDGGSAGDPEGNAQSLDTWLGKLLRISVDAGEPYAIPVDNPFTRGGGLPEVWAYGLRNPWRFSFDSLTRDLYIGDVGQGSWEEINFLPADTPGGANFGWDYFEGAHPYAGSPPADLAIISPVAEYSHSQGISVTGGYVYRGPSLPEFQGVYLYGDYGSGFVWGLLRKADGAWENDLLFQPDATITSFGVDEEGEIYLVDYGGNILRLERK